MTSDIHAATKKALTVYLGGIESTLSDGKFLVGDQITLADICFAAEIIQFSQSRGGNAALHENGLEPLAGETMEASWPRAAAHMRSCAAFPEFAPDLGAYLAKIDAKAAHSARY